MKGEYNHSIDVKGRLNFPAKFRLELGEKFVVCMGLDKHNKCLYVYSPEEWGKLEEKINRLPLSKVETMRGLYAAAIDVQPDGQGRILISDKLRKYAGLNKKATIIGTANHAEIWDTGAYEKAMEGFSIAGIVDELDALDDII